MKKFVQHFLVAVLIGSVLSISSVTGMKDSHLSSGEDSINPIRLSQLIVRRDSEPGELFTIDEQWELKNFLDEAKQNGKTDVELVICLPLMNNLRDTQGDFDFLFHVLNLYGETIRTLNLCALKISDNEVTRLCELKSLKNLTKLYLRSNKITLVGAQLLENWELIGNLILLDLKYNNFSEAELGTIRQFEKLNQIRFFMVSPPINLVSSNY